MSDSHPIDPRLEQVLNFPLVSSLLGRRSRRFGYGMTIPSGPLAYRSVHEPLPLSELETALLVGAATGVTGWNFGIPFTVNEPESLSNYSLRLTGRTAPSAATICTTELFYSDDAGIYLTRTRDLPPERLREFESSDDITRILGLSKAATYQLSQQRLTLPRQPPHFDEHNLWNSNRIALMAVSPCAIRRSCFVFTRRRTTLNWNFTISSSIQVPICAPTQNIWNVGILRLNKKSACWLSGFGFWSDFSGNRLSL